MKIKFLIRIIRTIIICYVEIFLFIFCPVLSRFLNTGNIDYTSYEKNGKQHNIYEYYNVHQMTEKEKNVIVPRVAGFGILKFDELEFNDDVIVSISVNARHQRSSGEITIKAKYKTLEDLDKILKDFGFNPKDSNKGKSGDSYSIANSVTATLTSERIVIFTLSTWLSEGHEVNPDEYFFNINDRVSMKITLTTCMLLIIGNIPYYIDYLYKKNRLPKIFKKVLKRN